VSEINTSEFMTAFDRWVETTEISMSDTIASTAMQLYTGIVKRTPVDTGRLKGNWQISINSVDGGEKSRTDETPLGRYSQSNASAEESKVNGFNASKHGYIAIHNNLPYAERIENGYSGQAPSGMARVTLSEFERALNQAARDNQI
jgi:hypothetical protein